MRHCTAHHGTSWHRTAQHGTARHSMEKHDIGRHCMSHLGTVQCAWRGRGAKYRHVLLSANGTTPAAHGCQRHFPTPSVRCRTVTADLRVAGVCAVARLRQCVMAVCMHTSLRHVMPPEAMWGSRACWMLLVVIYQTSGTCRSQACGALRRASTMLQTHCVSP